MDWMTGSKRPWETFDNNVFNFRNEIIIQFLKNKGVRRNPKTEFNTAYKMKVQHIPMNKKANKTDCKETES